MNEIKVKKEIYNEMDLMKRVDKLDKESKYMILNAFYIPNLFVAMSDEEQYKKHVEYLENTIKLYEKVKYAFEKLHTLCCVTMYEDTPAGQIDKMLETYDILDHDSKTDFRRKLSAQTDLTASLEDLKYNWDTFCESVKKNANSQKSK